MNKNKILKFFMFVMFSIINIGMIVDPERFRDLSIIIITSVAMGFILAKFNNEEDF